MRTLALAVLAAAACLSLVVDATTAQTSAPNAIPEAAKPAPPRAVADEVASIANACRYFRELYGRWPKDLAELKARTQGIDYKVFALQPAITPLENDTEQLRFSDGVNSWERNLNRMIVQFPPSVIREAQKPGFKLQVKGT